jgi:hypothetical protein
VIDARLAQKTQYITSWLSITFPHCIICALKYVEEEKRVDKNNKYVSIYKRALPK